MQNVTMTFGNSINVSLQVGDAVFYAVALTNTSFTQEAILEEEFIVQSQETQSTSCQHLGFITSVDSVNNTIVVSNVVDSLNVEELASQNPYFFFSKNPIANVSSLKGYYGLLSIRNNDGGKAELFNVSAEITGSSK